MTSISKSGGLALQATAGPVSHFHEGKTWHQCLPEELCVPSQPREELPDPAEPRVKLTVWNLAKNWVGKASADLHRLSLPVYINEPLTDLQRRLEAFEYSELLDQAAEAGPGSRDRLLAVTGYAVSLYATIMRTDKPFKDLFGATYEYIDPVKGLRGFAEKVVHHPPSHAMIVEGRKWRFEANDEMHVELWVGSLKIAPTGALRLIFSDGEEYRWCTAQTYVHNLIMGKRYISHRGPFFVKCMTNGETIEAEIRESVLGSLLGRPKHQIQGYLHGPEGRVPGYKVHGRWNDELYATLPDGTSRLLFKMNNPPARKNSMTVPDVRRRWNMSAWAIKLNELTPALAAKLPVTDARRRRDVRLFEEGFSEKANEEKDRLESKQRKDRLQAEMAGQPWKARWFELIMDKDYKGDSYLRWVYKGGYWEARSNDSWPTDMRDPYGL